MRIKAIIAPVLVLLIVVGIVSWAQLSPVGPPDLTSTQVPDMTATLGRLNHYLEVLWEQDGLTPAQPADDLQVLRRLSLALHGTIPSLEEIRAFEDDQGPDRISRWTARMLADNRFADYFAERLARSFVGVGGGPFIIFRRDRFVGWLTEQLRENRPYDELVRDMISGTGLWTDQPATNFVTVGFANDELDVNKLAGRAVRAFLGQRIDCAQCHDHPFDEWKQTDFQGLAAHFAQVRLSPVGIEDTSSGELEVRDPVTIQDRIVPPVVPFHREWLPLDGSRRERLAAWITHPENRRFERAIANRVWGLMFGRPYSQPVDDLPDPGDPSEPDLPDILGADFREHGYDLGRLIQVVAASRPFRLASTHPSQDPDQLERLKEHWAVFPLVRLRPEQAIGAMLQAASIQAIDRNSHLMVRTIRFFREGDFVQEYGDMGEDELEDRSGTVAQALLRMNGKLSHEMTETDAFTSAGRIAAMASTDERCLEACYLVCLTRRPTPQEREHFLAQLDASQDGERETIVQDIFWSLFNSPEFAWNH